MSTYLQVFEQPIHYCQETTNLLTQFDSHYTQAGKKQNILLLDSAEIGSKNSLNSWMLVKSAVRIECRGNRVTLQAETPNGQAALGNLHAYVSHHYPEASFIKSFTRAQVQADPTAEAVTGLATPNVFLLDQLVCEFAPVDQALDEDARLKVDTVFTPLRLLQAMYQHSRQPVFLGGLFAYDLVANFIPLDKLPEHAQGTDCPDYVFYLAEQLVTIAHQEAKAILHTYAFSPLAVKQVQADAQALHKISQDFYLNNYQGVVEPLVPASAEVSVNIDDESFKGIVTQLKEHVYVGDVFQIVPSREFAIACPNPLASYQALKRSNPSPYMFYLRDESFILFGASPESALKYDAVGRQVEVYPIAGSRPRGFDGQGNIDPELDAKLELELRLDTKEQAEHLMLVDLARNDVARVSEPGTRRLADLMQVDRYSHIMHLVSRVVGTLRSDLDALHAYQASMNMGTLTGAPKVKAQQLLYKYEGKRRRSYGGAVGYLNSAGSLDTCIVIRSAWVQDGIARIQAGAGVVLDSNPQAEADETRHKARAVINAITGVNQRANQQ